MDSLDTCCSDVARVGPSLQQPNVPPLCPALPRAPKRRHIEPVLLPAHEGDTPAEKTATIEQDMLLECSIKQRDAIEGIRDILREGLETQQVWQEQHLTFWKDMSEAMRVLSGSVTDIAQATIAFLRDSKITDAFGKLQETLERTNFLLTVEHGLVHKRQDIKDISTSTDSNQSSDSTELSSHVAEGGGNTPVSGGDASSSSNAPLPVARRQVARRCKRAN